MNDSTATMPPEAKEDRASGKLNQLIQSIQRFATIAEILRFVGAATMIASMSLLLLKGWHDGDDIYRYLKLLGLTGLLAVGGFSLSYLLKEQKGARLFFSLGIVSVPANFGILGALIFSLVPKFGPVTAYPDFAYWVVSDVSSVAMVGLGALFVLLPVTILGFKILAKDSAKLLTLSYLGLNTLLLLPFRDSLLVGVMLAIALIAPAIVSRISLSKDATLHSIRGKYSMAVLFIPAAILLVRNLYLYQLDCFLGLVFCVSIYWVIRQWSMSETISTKAKLMLEIISVPLAFGGALFVADLTNTYFLDLLFSVSLSAVLGLFLVDYQNRAEPSLLKWMIVTGTAGVISVALLASTLMLDTAAIALLATLFGIALFMFGFYARYRSIVFIGLAQTLLAAWFGLSDIVALLLSGDWLALAIVGGVAIIGASLVDRFGPTIRYHLSHRLAGDIRAIKSE